LETFNRRELPDAITSLWKDRYLQRLDLEPFSKDQCVGLIEQALGGPVKGLSAVDPPRSAAIVGGYHPSCSKRTENLSDSSFLGHSKIQTPHRCLGWRHRSPCTPA
jgi:hypothetical protein